MCDILLRWRTDCLRHGMRKLALLTTPLLCLAIGCAASSDDDVKSGEDDFSSSQATLLDFEFNGEVQTSGTFFGGAQAIINDQMLYTIGQLNGDDSVGRLDRLKLSNIQQTRTPEGKTKITYTARLPVSWGAKANLPTKYEFTLPRDASYEGQQAFTTKYKTLCAERGAHDVDAGSMWYYYRPKGCTPDAADVVKFTATASKSLENTEGKYPEYDKVWEDGQLNMVAIFGKYEDGKTSGDAGIDAYNRFLATMRTELSRYSLTTAPATVPASPGVSAPDVTFNATLPDGKKVSVTALLVDNVRTADANFNTRYNALSTNADIISYNGHAGLGQNVRALAQKGSWKAGKYVIVFMNGCDTFAYVDGSLAETRARINADDPTGTKYMEFITNTLPAFFSSMANASSTLMKGLLRYDAPMTYDQIFQGIDDSQVVVVTGEEDNTFTPGSQPPANNWQGIRESFEVARGVERRFETGTLQPGSYAFDITGTGDADLYVKVGSAVSKTAYDCRPYKGGSTESCVVKVTTPANVSVMVRGYGSSSKVDFTGKKQ
jgi:hypothetical protein